MRDKADVMPLLDPGDESIAEELREELTRVERRFVEELASDLSCVNRLVKHVERYRGKMLRPTLVLLSARAAQPESSSASTVPRRDHGNGSPVDPSRDREVVAAVVEMVHMATLVHDDILDDADIRRRGSTVNRLVGNESAVMLGDYLISHAYHLCNSLDKPWVGRAISAATNTVCEGELLQLSNRRNWSLDEATYREIIRRKTASLCGVCCRLGARMQGVDDAVIQHLGRFGEHLGEAFQIVDDLLDLTGDEATVGKTLGRDLDKGKLTLPLLRMLATLSESQRASAYALLDRLSEAGHAQALGHDSPGPPAVGDESAREHAAGNGAATDDAALRADSRQLLAMLDASGAVEASFEQARSLIDQAKACLTEVAADSPARRTLLSMADRVIERRL